jgi:hypothetical protein
MPRATNENLDATVKFLSAPLALLLLEIRVLAQAEACTSCKVNMPPTLPKLHAPCTRDLTAAGRMHVLPKIIRVTYIHVGAFEKHPWVAGHMRRPWARADHFASLLRRILPLSLDPRRSIIVIVSPSVPEVQRSRRAAAQVDDRARVCQRYLLQRIRQSLTCCAAQRPHGPALIKS